MQIHKHAESHVVEMKDGSKWQIFPGDLDLTLGWEPSSELDVIRIDDELSSHAIINKTDGTRVRCLPLGEKWPVRHVQDALKEG
ncbi:MAG TPA: hypothetical protein VGC26_00420 [Afipia sp.]